MIARRGRPWTIVAIATFVLVANASTSGSAELSKPPAATKLSPRLTRSVNTQPIGGLFDDELNRVEDAHRRAVLTARNNYSRDYAISYWQNYRFFSGNSSEPGATRYKRYVEFSETRLSNASDSATIARPANASEALRNGTLARVPLYRSRRYIRIPQATKILAHHEDVPFSSLRTCEWEKRPSGRRANFALPYDPPSSRTRRSLTTDIHTPRRNASDYYAERRAVMARFYARQREIEERYGNRTNSSSNPGNAAPWNDPRNVTLFRLYPSRNLTDNRAAFRYPSITIDPVYNNLASKLDGQPAVQEVDRRFGLRAWNNSNFEGQVVRYYTTPVPCANASLTGTLAPKKRSKAADTSDGHDVHATDSESNGTDHEVWGKCKGKVVYQHNLLLGLKGPSTLDTIFEVIIQGPVCITCVETLRYNETRAKVKLESGGRGNDYVKLKLQGYENEGFSYIIKVWGVKKIGPDCSNV